MKIQPLYEEGASEEPCLLHFWAIGDLHYRARPQWQAIHSRRLAPMFQDLRSLWQEAGTPAFVVSPGDVVQTGAPENYRLAQRELVQNLGDVPFYPGIGNHEYHRERAGDTLHDEQQFSIAWGKPVRYAWETNGITCIMLDHPDPYSRDDHQEDTQVMLSQASLAYLDTTLQEHPDQPAIVFAHCPLRNTVLDRDPAHDLDADSLDPFFFVENSAAVREILARHSQVALYISGHTHSGWESPGLVCTEMLGKHPVTHVNLMSPWYTGRHHGPRRIDGPEKFAYQPDKPDILPSFAFYCYPRHIIIRVRDHHTRQWLAQWIALPLSSAKGI